VPPPTFPSMAGGPAMDEAIVVPWCWDDQRGPGAWGWERRDSNALFSQICRLTREECWCLCFPCFPFLAAFFRAVLEGGIGGLED
jgi:hypothetical protein